MVGRGPDRRQLWLVVALAILLLIVSWSVVAIVDGVTHSNLAPPTPPIERTRVP